jgi:hypothetical protein
LCQEWASASAGRGAEAHAESTTQSGRGEWRARAARAPSARQRRERRAVARRARRALARGERRARVRNSAEFARCPRKARRARARASSAQRPAPNMRARRAAREGQERGRAQSPEHRIDAGISLPHIVARADASRSVGHAGAGQDRRSMAGDRQPCRGETPARAEDQLRAAYALDFLCLCRLSPGLPRDKRKC